MELLDFKTKLFEIFNITETSKLGEQLMNIVMNNDIEGFTKVKELLSDDRDMLQSLWQYYESDRTQKKQDYTPKSICYLFQQLAGKQSNYYDMCVGSGALSLPIVSSNNNATMYIEELDENVIPFLLFNLCLANANAIVSNGDVLKRQFDKFYKISKGEIFSTCEQIDGVDDVICDVTISNPPYNIKWDKPTELEMVAEGLPIDIPKNNANYAFVRQGLLKSNKEIILLPVGVLNGINDKNAREYLVENNLLDAVITLPENMFEATSISTVVLILDKNKSTEDVVFIDHRYLFDTEIREQRGQFGSKSHTNRIYTKTFNVLNKAHIKHILDVYNNRTTETNFSCCVENKAIIEKDYLWNASMYIEYKPEEEDNFNIQQLADAYNMVIKMKNSCKLVINETLANRLGMDVQTFKAGVNNSKQIAKNLKEIGINVEKDDFIQFTKNKNEFILKANDASYLSTVFTQALQCWINNIALLNDMENKYLNDLRDVLLEKIMSGEIDVSNVTLD